MCRGNRGGATRGTQLRNRLRVGLRTHPTSVQRGDFANWTGRARDRPPARQGTKESVCTRLVVFRAFYYPTPQPICESSRSAGMFALVVFYVEIFFVFGVVVVLVVPIVVIVVVPVVILFFVVGFV